MCSLRKSFVALLTLVTLFSTMSQSVSPQILRLIRIFVTFVTFEQLLSSVSKNMLISLLAAGNDSGHIVKIIIFLGALTLAGLVMEEGP